jgi:phosphoribosylformylglycinamidine synthase I
MQAVIAAAGRGVPVLGVCNGFQILTEAGLLPGALMRNAGIRFVCRTVGLTVENSQSMFTSGYSAGEKIHIPVAHHDGNFFADDATLDRLEGEGRVAFRYAEPVNGSARNIAGVLNDAGNVLGMMPHPERMIEAVAQICRHYQIPVTPQTVLSHAEVQETLGIQQAGKWDFTWLPIHKAPVGARAAGDYIRMRVQTFKPTEN